jgi:molecular chaperone GrpE
VTPAKEPTSKIKVKTSAKPASSGKAGAPPPAESAAPQAEAPTSLEEISRQAEEHYDKYLRACADLENFRKRAERERVEYLKYANEALIKELLIVSDNLCRALEHAETTTDLTALKEGVEMTLKGLNDVLARFGVSEVQAQGCAFDPNVHEAVSVQESDQAEDNAVVNVAQKGFLLHDRLLRPAMVVVNRRPEGSGDS